MRIKAACHVHSTWSYDGKWSLPELADAFGRRGYRVLLMTEHDRGFTSARLEEYFESCVNASTETVKIVPGIEYSDPTNTMHILVWGMNTFLGEALPTGELLNRVESAGGLAVMAHPSRKDAWKQFDRQWIPHLLGIEVWNRKTDGWAPSKTAAPLMAGTTLLPFVGMDFHTGRQFFPLSTELEIPSVVGVESVLESLRLRRCRSLAMDRPIEDFLPEGWRRSGLRAVEFARRTAARTVRTLKRV